jgi:hypothetical protein
MIAKRQLDTLPEAHEKRGGQCKRVPEDRTLRVAISNAQVSRQKTFVYIGGESESDPEQSRDEHGNYANQNDRPRRHPLPFSSQRPFSSKMRHGQIGRVTQESTKTLSVFGRKNGEF